jgi:hypothetical protein
VGVLVVALAMSINSVSRYSAQAPDPEADTAQTAQVVVAALPETDSEAAREAVLRERCRKEVETTNGRELAQAVGEQTIIDLCVETAEVLED